ncbi:MAG TPA: prepilin-type N-terminal cleavage/methylation domain-containing protein [Acidimicrobiales bacterium]|nr:prepilin-type N-terminal cleavage/methylation domain-containing protein [Acidimicrobiales bacterium]
MARHASPLRAQEGFSLVEVAVVLTIIGIILAIAIPTFLSASGRAAQRAVEVDLRTALTSALVLAQESSSFTVGDRPIEAADLAEMEPALAFGDVATTEVIGVATDDDDLTLRLDKLNAAGERVTLVAVIGRGVRLCVGDDTCEADEVV